MPRETRPSAKAVTLLATCYVIFGGMVALAFIVLSFDKDPLPKLLAVAGVALALVGLTWLLRDRSPGRSSSRSTSGWFRRRSVSRSVWRVAVKRPQNEEAPHPPTVEDVRELSQNTSTWVPSKRPPGREA